MFSLSFQILTSACFLTSRSVSAGVMIYSLLDEIPKIPPLAHFDKSCTLRLNLSNAGISRVRRNFIEDENIKELILQGNSLTEFEKGAFDSLPNLSALDLSGNELAADKMFGFGTHPVLELLILDDNSPPAAAKDSSDELLADSVLPALKFLSARNTGIRSVAPELGNQLPILSHLDLSANPIDAQRLFASLPQSVSHLYLKKVGLKDLKIRDTANVTALFLDENAFETISTRYGRDKTLSLQTEQAKALQELSVANCGIKRIESEAFKTIAGLLYLNISGNSIGEIAEKTFAHLPNLQVMDVSRNDLRSMPNFSGLKQLLALVMDDIKNQAMFATLGGEAFDLPNLKTLSLQGNGIQAIGMTSLSNLPALEELNLSRNKLKELRVGWHPNSALKRLYLENNQINFIEDLTLNETKHLELLDIRHNAIFSFKPSSFSLLPANVTIQTG